MSEIRFSAGHHRYGDRVVLDGIELDPRGNIYISDVVRNEIWVLSRDGKQRILVANKANAPLDDNSSLVFKDGVLCTANLGYRHRNSVEADRTVVCMTGFPVPK
jgi:sugar lactone lactonase YvrE